MTKHDKQQDERYIKNETTMTGSPSEVAGVDSEPPIPARPKSDPTGGVQYAAEGQEASAKESNGGKSGIGPEEGGERAGGTHRRDLTVGSIPKHLATFALPFLIGNIFQALYNTVDSIWVGRYVSKAALGAISASFPIIMFLVALFMGIGMATTVLVSQYAGAKEEKMVKRTISNSLFLVAIGSVFITIIGIVFSGSILKLLNVPSDILPMASGYLKIYFSGIIFMLGYNIVSAIFQGLGDSRTPVYFLVIAVTINMIIDPVFILGLGPVPKMGVPGAAIATVLSMAVSFIASIYYLKKTGGPLDLSFENLKLDAELTKKTLTIGLPSGVQQTIVSVGIMVLNSIVNSFGTTVVAAFGAASRLDQFSMMPAMSLSMATSAIAGQNIGAGRNHRVKEVVVWSSAFAAVIAAAITFIALVYPRALISLFTSDEGVLGVGEQYLRTVGIGYIPFALMFVMNGLLRGAGDTMPGMVFAVINLWVVRVPLARWLSSMDTLGSRGIWIAMAVSSFIGALMSWTYYMTGRWKKKRIIQGPGPGQRAPQDSQGEGE